MKKTVLSALLLLAGLGGTQAANFYATNLGSGVTLLNGSTALANGAVRFGTFPAGFDVAANKNNFTALNAAFIEVVALTGPINAQGSSGFFDVNQSYATNVNYGGLPYDGSAGVVNNVDGDIAGSKVYIWVLNAATAATATEQAIFVTNQTWADADDLVADTFVTPDASASGLEVVAGRLSTGNDIGAGVASHRTGAALADVIVSRTPAGASVDEDTQVVFTANVSGGFGPTYQWRKNGQPIDLATGPTFTLPAAQIADTGDYDVVVTDGGDSQTSNQVNLTVLEAQPAIPQIVQQPVAQIVAVGDSLDLSVGAIGAGTLKYQWKKGANIAGATTPSISIPNVTLKSAGAYNVVVTNGPGAGTGTATSNKVEVAVVDTTPATLPVALNGTAKLSALAAGKGITYQWYKDGVALTADPKSKAKTYSVKVTEAGLAGNYTCAISLPGVEEPVFSGVQSVVLISEAPAFVGGASISLPDGIVGGDYNVNVYTQFMDLSPAKTPLSFKAAKLPAGLKIDAKTGVISGRPTKATSGPVTATITAVTTKDAGSSVVASASISIAAFPTNLAGTFIGSIPRHATIGSNLGGRLDFTVSALGAVSGKLTLGTDAAVAFKGAVDAADSVLRVEILRKTSYLPLILELEVDTETGALVDASLTEEETSVAIQGWRNTGVGTTYAGATNFGLLIPEALEGETDIPQGVSHGVITVKAPAGTLTIAGKTADGEKITGSAFVGPDGQVVLHQSLYTPVKGTMTGVLDLNRAAEAEDDTITGTLTWNRPAATSTRTRMYQVAGFGPIELTPVGGRYVAPASGVILDVAADSNASLLFEEAGISTEANDPSVTVQLGAKNKVVIANNPEKTALKVDPKKGAISGTIVQPTNRKTTFAGQVVQTPAGLRALGYFLLAQAPEGSEKPTQTPVLSGYVSLTPIALPPPPPCNTAE